MHDIEPYHKWRDQYISSQDDKSPLFGRVYDEFTFTNKVYNYFVHPQWDDFGSQTLYGKILFVDYSTSFCCIELIGEWNDCINNDIMFLKRELVDLMTIHDISKFTICCDNVMNFHSSDDSYYEEWYDDVKEEGGWITFINTMDHVKCEMESVRLQHYVNIGPQYNDMNWRNLKPLALLDHIENLIKLSVKQLSY